MVVVLTAVLIVGCPATASAQATATPAPSGVAADDVYGTVPIELRPGAIRLDWGVERADPATGCTASARLRPEGTARPVATVYAVRLSGPGEGVETGRLPLDGIGPGRYLLDLGGAGCWWSLNVVEQ